MITVLLFDHGDCAVLQRTTAGTATSSRSGEAWEDVVLPQLSDEPVFVVQIGDCLSEMSGGALKSTLHRVAQGPGSYPRTSLALFLGLDPEAVRDFHADAIAQFGQVSSSVVRCAILITFHGAAVL